jgi:hypothetical protein
MHRFLAVLRMTAFLFFAPDRIAAYDFSYTHDRLPVLSHHRWRNSRQEGL